MNLVENVDHYTSSCGYCSCGDSAAMVSFRERLCIQFEARAAHRGIELVVRDCFVMLKDDVLHNIALRHQGCLAKGFTVLYSLKFPAMWTYISWDVCVLRACGRTSSAVRHTRTCWTAGGGAAGSGCTGLCLTSRLPAAAIPTPSGWMPTSLSPARCFPHKHVGSREFARAGSLGRSLGS